MYLSVIVTVGGREAIPLRAIPFVTGRQVTPDMLVRALAADEGWEVMRGLAAYRPVPDSPRKMLPREWDAVLVDLKTLRRQLESEESTPNDRYPDWRDQSLRFLPAGCFVWCDEFEGAYEQYRSLFLSPADLPYSVDRPHWGGPPHWVDPPRWGDEIVDYTPYLGGLSEFVMEGFGAVEPEVEQKSGSTGRERAAWQTERAQLLKLVYGMACDKYGFDPVKSANAATGTKSGGIAAGLEKLGLKIDTKTVHKHVRAGAELWAAAGNDQ